MKQELKQEEGTGGPGNEVRCCCCCRRRRCCCCCCCCISLSTLSFLLFLFFLFPFLFPVFIFYFVCFDALSYPSFSSWAFCSVLSFPSEFDFSFPFFFLPFFCYVALCCIMLFFSLLFLLFFSLFFSVFLLFQFRRDPPLWLALMLSLVNFKLGSFRFNEFVYRDWEGGGEEVMVLFFFSSSSSSSFFFFFVFLLFFVYWVRLEIDMKVNRFQFYTVFFFVQSSGSTRENDSFFHRRLGRFPVADTAEGPRIIQISQLDF